MDDSELEHLRVKLKSGEYDGVDIMRAWLALDEARSMRKDAERYRLLRACADDCGLVISFCPPGSSLDWTGVQQSYQAAADLDEAIDAAMNGANA